MDEGNGWHQTACILCSINCGIEVRVDGPTIARVRGDKAHPGSEGYTCEKALRLDHYQNGPHRLTTPLRRRPDGTFEAIDWDTAIAEVAARFRDVIDAHGGAVHPLLRRRRPGQPPRRRVRRRRRGNALGIRYSSNALAQEKTGEFWVDGQLFGRSRCHTTGDYEHAQVAVFWGKNPWQSHGFPQARRHLKAIAGDPQRTLDRRRSAPHRDRRPRRHPPPAGARRRRPSARRPARRARRGGPARRPLAGRARRRPRRRRSPSSGGVDIAASCAKAGVAEERRPPQPHA